MLQCLLKFTNLFIIVKFSLTLGYSFGFGYLAIKLMLPLEQIDNDFLIPLGILVLSCIFAIYSILIIWSLVFDNKLMLNAVIILTFKIISTKNLLKWVLKFLTWLR